MPGPVTEVLIGEGDVTQRAAPHRAGSDEDRDQAGCAARRARGKGAGQMGQVVDRGQRLVELTAEGLNHVGSSDFRGKYPAQKPGFSMLMLDSIWTGETRFLVPVQSGGATMSGN